MSRINELYAMVEATIERTEQDLQALRALHDAWKKEDASSPHNDEKAPCDVVWLTREEAAQWVSCDASTLGKYGSVGLLERRKISGNRWAYALPVHRYAFESPPAGHSWQTFDDAAKCLGISTTTLQKWAKSGKILRQLSWFGRYIYAVPCEQTPPPRGTEDGLLNL